LVVQIILTKSSKTVGEAQQASGSLGGDPIEIFVRRQQAIKLADVVVEPEHVAHIADTFFVAAWLNRREVLMRSVRLVALMLSVTGLLSFRSSVRVNTHFSRSI